MNTSEEMSWLRSAILHELKRRDPDTNYVLGDKADDIDWLRAEDGG